MKTYKEETPKCKIHGKEVKKVYSFGNGLDAELTVYYCGCCDVVNLQGINEVYHYNNYNAAAGKARMIVAQNRAW